MRIQKGDTVRVITDPQTQVVVEGQVDAVRQSTDAVLDYLFVNTPQDVLHIWTDLPASQVQRVEPVLHPLSEAERQRFVDNRGQICPYCAQPRLRMLRAERATQGLLLVLLLCDHCRATLVAQYRLNGILEQHDLDY